MMFYVKQTRPQAQHRRALAQVLGEVDKTQVHLDGTVTYMVPGCPHHPAGDLARRLKVDWLELAPTLDGWRVTVPVPPTLVRLSGRVTDPPRGRGAGFVSGSGAQGSGRASDHRRAGMMRKRKRVDGLSIPATGGEYARLVQKHNALLALSLGDDAPELPPSEYGRGVRTIATEIGELSPAVIRQFIAEIRQAGAVVYDVDKRDDLRKIAMQWWVELDGPDDVNPRLLDTKGEYC